MSEKGIVIYVSASTISVQALAHAWADRCRTVAHLAGSSRMHWSVCVSYEHGIPVAVRWHDCGFDQPSLCLLPDEPTPRFAYARPADHCNPLPADERFLHACGVRPPDTR